MFFDENSFDPVSWNDPKFHMKNLIRTQDSLARWVSLSEGEKQGIALTQGKYNWMVTPYYASLMDKTDPLCPIRLQSVPCIDEMRPPVNSDVDPVGDMENLKTRRIIHKYPNRVVFLVSDTCPVYCRHCTRKYHTTDVNGTYFDENFNQSYEPDFRYIESHSEIDDVLLTGGDPLTLTDRVLERIISRLRSISHINIIRIGSRYPVLLPQRITEDFCGMLSRYHPIWLNTHFNHPKEITPAAAAACDRLLRYGVPVQNQSVLLRGVNDTSEIMKNLMKGLLGIRVRPYYIYHCDNVTGVSHFRTSVAHGQAIMDSMFGYQTGFSVPSYVLTTPIGKIPIQKEYISYSGNSIIATNYAGKKMELSDYLARDEVVNEE